MKKLLFISHAASRSGAPFVLLYLLQWLRQNSEYRFDVLLLYDGPLKNDFSIVADNVYVLPQLLANDTLLYKVRRRLKLVPGEEARLNAVLHKIRVQEYAIIYGNTIVCLPLLRSIQRISKARTVIAIHELTTSIETFHTREYVATELPELDCIIAGSGAVAHNLQQRYAVPARLIRVVHAFIHKQNLPAKDSHVLRQAGVPEKRFIVGGAGTPEWRKGTDLIVPLGTQLKTTDPSFNFHIVWVGGAQNDLFIKHLQTDIEKTGLQGHVTLVENTKDYLDFIQGYDVFIMLSREDPFPLVSIEAAYLQKPILMFSGTGGTAEIIESGGGIAVPYMDINSLANEIIRLWKDEPLRVQMGKKLSKEVLTHYNSDVACQKVHTILNTLGTF